MIYLIIITILISIISIIIVKSISKKLRGRALDEIQRYKEVEFQKEKEKYIKKLEVEFDAAKAKKYQELESLNNEIIRRNELFEIDKKTKEQLLKATLEAKREEGMTRVNREVDDWAASMQESANWEKDRILNENKKIYDASKKELDLVLEEVKRYKEKRDAINQDILRARALEEQQDFYRIQLDEISKKDLTVINSIRSEISKIDLLDKLLYDIYVKKPVDEMIKRVLGGRAPSGIYKITRLKTGEIYIGKSTDVKARWQQHVKSAFHCGTISHSILHTTMERDGVDNFTFELIEEVPKDKLGEREKYWIEFYDSKNFGLNMREG